MKTGLMAIMAVLAVAACNRTSFETKPVVINTPKGKVTCQLYMADRVQWDESIARPASMTQKEADDLCVKKGAQQLKAVRAITR